jgi:hypothetical protein
MSPDEAQNLPTQAVATDASVAAEAKPKRNPFAFMGKASGSMGKAGDSLGKYPVIKKVPRSMRLVVIILILVIIVAAIAVGLPKGDDTPDGPKVLVIDNLEDFSWTSSAITGNLPEFSSFPFMLEDLMEANGTYFIDRLEATVTWTDEPDQRWGGRIRVNAPDHFAIEFVVGGNISSKSDFVGNDPDSKQGSVSHYLEMSSTNFTFVMMGNASGVEIPEDVLMGGIDVVVWLDEAEDLYASGPAAIKLNDVGNDYSLVITVSGKVLSE